ncbi:cholestenol delta-isomerase [Sporothrix brasiliensis 5110]|uniref:Cholestenol delta-isomerase n=1 Tax=Sporothrix brasiliensis 5110 TaxID=1398154 RepID=A0A0C2J588_9PEZI|nr:cholestenol delta-isomerase [Sporothrix brasiliensis 5110]KIH94135.1 cholestenol delta-isomerase [Sporothrix brasiliensis 5110]
MEQPRGAAAAPGSLPLDHPYYPPGLSIPNFDPNTSPLWLLFVYFASALAMFLVAAFLVARLATPRFRQAPFSDKALFIWFTLCGGLHWFFEGYFVKHHATLAGSQTVRAQLWKEYALSDSRYLTSDPFMLCVEGLTVLVQGSLCFLTAATIVYGARLPAGRSGLRHVLQMVVSTVHLFGVLLYYGTLLFEESIHGASHCRPEFQYRWVYFAGMNAPWVAVPLYALYSSSKSICRVFATVNSISIDVLSVCGAQTSGKKDQ